MPRLTPLLRTLHSRPLLPAYSKLLSRTSFKFAMSTTPHEVPKLNDPSLLQPYPFLNNQFLKPTSSTPLFDVHDPATNKVIASIPEQTADDAEKFISAANGAFKTFKHTTPRERSVLLRKWYDEVIKNADDLAKLITLENGKPLADAKGEVQYAASFLLWFSEEAPRLNGQTIKVSNALNRVVTSYEPVGVCGLITPWNFPAAMITRKLGPAIAAGCTSVVKAPAETPLTCLALMELARRAGMPEGVINVLTSMKHTPDIGNALCNSKTVRKISFTGSTPVGKTLMGNSSQTLKKLSFELGGNAPFIVFDDADIEKAVDGAVTSKFRSSGQTCVCANRIFVHDSLYDRFAEKLAGKVKDFKVGHGFTDGVTHGPLIHTRALDKVHDHVQDAVSKGAKLLVGGEKLPHVGENFYAPTVLRDVTCEMKLQSEETFGPIAGLFRFKTEKEVVEMANTAEVGLAAYVYSNDMGRVWRVAEALEVGMVGVNTGLISDPAAPFGGVKESGFGREGSTLGIHEYVVVKQITFGGVGGELQG